MELNKELKNKLEKIFRPKGIIPFTNCCRFRCTDTFGDDPEFKSRDEGIYFIRLDLGGLNYFEEVKIVYVHYDNFDYVMSHWDNEKKIIDEWISACNRCPNGCSVTKPENKKTPIKIEFNKPLHLEEMVYSDSEPEF